MIRRAIHKSFGFFGLDITRSRNRKNQHPPDFRDDECEIVRKVGPWTMTSPERIYALIQAVKYVSSNAIPGAIVECGVWKGGSMAAAARALVQANDNMRHLYLFDTFAGMSEPTAGDVEYTGKHAVEVLRQSPGHRCADAPLNCTKRVMLETGYPAEKIHFVVGKVEETVPGAAPDIIAVLRLDTDWYQSTKHELVHLFPRLSRGGVIIIDDYGHWQGSRQACDEYFSQNHIPILLNRIDYTGRIALKP